MEGPQALQQQLTGGQQLLWCGWACVPLLLLLLMVTTTHLVDIDLNGFHSGAVHILQQPLKVLQQCRRVAAGHAVATHSAPHSVTQAVHRVVVSCDSVVLRVSVIAIICKVIHL